MVRRRRRIAVFALVIATGLLVGMAIRSALTPPVNRGDRMVALFEEWCIPALRGARSQPDGVLISYPVTLDTQNWLDPLTGLMLENSRDHCKIMDATLLLTDSERASVARQVANRVKIWDPTLKQLHSQTDLGWDLLSTWVPEEGSDSQPDWAVYLSRVAKTGEDAQTGLTLSLPKELQH